MTVEQAIAFARSHLKTGDLPPAEQLCRQILSVQPQQVDANVLLGRIALAVGQPRIAESHFNTALNGRPSDLQIQFALAIALRQAGELDRSIQVLMHLLSLSPRFANAHNALGDALQAAGRLDEAIAAYQAEIEIDPTSADAMNNLGSAFQDAGQVPQAIAAFRQAMSRMPSHPVIHYNLALALLLNGEFAEGFAEHEWRWQVRQLGLTVRKFAQPAWDGKVPGGRRILLYCEQGFGDSIQFMRYAPILTRLGADVILQLPAELVSLAKTLSPTPHIVAFGDPLPAFDVHVAMLSLPSAMGTTLDSIPADVPYLSASSDQIDRWRRRVEDAANGKLKVGVTWAGRAQHTNDRNRSIRPVEFAPLLELDSVQFFNLQLGGQTLPSLVDWTNDLHDFAASAGLIANLDLVITVDTSVAHLAGALGKKVWLLLPFAPDWRWMRNRDDSPWYPTMRIFRQPRPGDWVSVIGQIRAVLASESRVGF